MSTAVLDANKRVTIDTLNETIEIKEQDGQVVGRYVPEADYKNMMYALAEAQCPLTKEELEERRKEKGGSTLKEIWKRLGRQ
ncbi:MAG: hypothetical protein QM703_10855 [Gemmatales bacterium]